MSSLSRRWVLGALAAATVPLAGCATRPLRSANADGTYCFRRGRVRGHPPAACTPTKIPPGSVEAEAKRFEPAPDRLTLYVVRKRWGDSENVVRIASDGAAWVITVPESFARLRLAPGSHQLTAHWSDATTALQISGQPGEVLYVELIGSTWAWGSTYRLELGDPRTVRARAADLRLVADVG